MHKMEHVMQVVIVTLSNPVFDNGTNDLKYDVTFVPNTRHNSTTADFYKRHANATGSPKVGSANNAPEGAFESSIAAHQMCPDHQPVAHAALAPHSSALLRDAEWCF